MIARAAPEDDRGARGAVVTRRRALAVAASLGLAVPLAATSEATGASGPLAPPGALAPFVTPARPGEGVWRPRGRRVATSAAVYTTLLRPPMNPRAFAGVAWMDTTLLAARLYSGSLSPGGTFWRDTAPIPRAAAKTLVAAFAGGFLLRASKGGYLSEGHLVAPLVDGAASLVILRDGTATVGRWGRDVTLGADVVAVRQNLTLLVDHGAAVAGLDPRDVATWGASLHQVVDTPRSGLGVTDAGALVYVEGPMNVVDLARLLVRAGAQRAMVLDMNPLWPVFAVYSPATPSGYATPGNGWVLTPSMIQTPARFFQSAYARDFVTMSAR